MLDPFDIFKLEQNGSVRWVRAIVDLERAKLCVLKILAKAVPGDYLILNQRSGERIIIHSTTHPQPSLKTPSLIANSKRKC